MRALLLITSLLIVYGSLYPFALQSEPVASTQIAQLINFNIFRTGLGDILSNVLVFLPFGYLYAEDNKARGKSPQLAGCLLLGFVLAWGIQFAQLWFAGRVPWGGDAALNLIGVLLGFLLSSSTSFLMSRKLFIGNTIGSVSLLIAIGLVIAKLAPFAPSLDFGDVKNNLKTLAGSPAIDPFWVFQNFSYWLAIFALLARSGLRLPVWHQLLLVAVTLGLKLFIVMSNLTLAHILGAILAMTVWTLMGLRIPQWLVATVFALGVLGYGLEPFEARSTPGAFHWMPFQGGLNGNMIINVAALIKKSLMYMGMVWLFYGVFGRLLWATALSALLVFAGEYAQRYVVDSVPEMTDAILTMMAALAIFHLQKRTKDFAPTYGSGEPRASAQSTGVGDSAGWVSKYSQYLNIKSAAIVLVLLVVGGAAIFLRPLWKSQPPIVQPSWAHEDASVVFDHHTHTRYSDGRLSPGKLVELAVSNGCDAIAITDHTDRRSSLSDKKLTEINELRSLYPRTLIFNGIELDMPTYKGREHVNIIASPSMESVVLKTIMDELYRYKDGDPRALESRLLGYTDSTNAQAQSTVAIYNHPSRKDKKAQENMRDVVRWQSYSSALIGIAGAPGHQKSQTNGSYKALFKTQHRWDPAIAEVGGTWDQLLQDGHRIWGAIASSDYHGSGLDYPPCAFSRIHVRVPVSGYDGLLAGLHGGTFWADHGGLLRRFKLSADAEGLEESVYPGALARLTDNDIAIDVRLELQRGDEYRGKVLRYDLISSCGTDTAEVVASHYLGPTESAREDLIPVNQFGSLKRCHIRARILRETPDGDTLAAYTNPIRFIL